MSIVKPWWQWYHTRRRRGAWTPRSVYGCRYWLPYDQGLTVTSDIKRWLDRSGFFFHTQQDTAANRPILSGSALRFTASGNEHLDRNAIGALGNGYTVGVALRTRAFDATSRWVFHNGLPLTDGFSVRFTSTARSLAHDTVGAASWGAPTTDPETWIFRHDGAGGNADFALNGSHQTQKALGNNVAPTSALTLGARNTGANASDVDVYGVIAYSDRKSDAIVADMNAYLTALRTGSPLPVWRPDDETNLLFWSDQPELYSGPALSDWANQGTVGGSVSQAAAASMPVYLPRSLTKDWPCVHFDGVDDFMADTVVSIGQPTAIYASALITEADTFLATLIDGDNPNFRAMYEGGATVRIWAGASLALTETGNAFHRLRALYDGATSELASDEGTPVVGNAGVSAATGLNLGRRASPGNYGDNNLSEFVMFDRELNPSEDAELDAYMIERFP